MNWVSIGSGNGLSPVRRQAITRTNAGLLSIGLLGTNFSENRIGILSFSFKKMHLKLSSANVAAILSRRRWLKTWSRGLTPGSIIPTSPSSGRVCLLLINNQSSVLLGTLDPISVFSYWLTSTGKTTELRIDLGHIGHVIQSKLSCVKPINMQPSRVNKYLLSTNAKWRCLWIFWKSLSCICSYFAANKHQRICRHIIYIYEPT